MIKPIAVIAGDIHYNLSNLEVADKGTRMAIAKANELNVPFIANGDTTDTKAILRAECVNRMIETFKTAKIKPYVNIGNHCKINNKSMEHALNFLAPYATIVDKPAYFKDINATIIPYYDDVNALREYLETIKTGTLLIMHQGVNGSNMGEYMQDASALNAADLYRFRTILSHYHARQDIQCGSNIASYIGSLYTTSFGEANDLEKGFQILYSDGSLEFVPTNLRKHVIIELEGCKPHNLISGPGLNEINEGDIVQVRVIGARGDLSLIDKNYIAKELNLKDFRLDLAPVDQKVGDKNNKNLTQPEMLDSMIDSLTNTEEQTKARLKEIWRAM